MWDIEKDLWLRISEEIEERKQRKEVLEREVEELKRRCEELVNVLNALVRE